MLTKQNVCNRSEQRKTTLNSGTTKGLRKITWAICTGLRKKKFDRKPKSRAKAS